MAEGEESHLPHLRPLYGPPLHSIPSDPTLCPSPCPPCRCVQRFFKLCMRKARHLTATERRLMLMWNCFTTAHPVYADYTVPARWVTAERRKGWWGWAEGSKE